MKLPHSQKQKCIRVCKRRQHYSCVFICLGDFRVWKFDVETSDLDYCSTAKYRRCCHSSVGMYRCLEHCAGASFLCCLSPVHDYSSVRNMTFTKQKKATPQKAFIPSSNMLICTKHIEIFSLSTLCLKDGEGTTAAQVSMAFSRSLELQMDFWSCIIYHVVMGMVEEKFCISVCISLFIAVEL